jgi:hypothetical protein
MFRHLLKITGFLTMIAFAPAALAEEMITIQSEHGQTPDAHGAAKVASYANLSVTYAAAADTSGRLYSVVGVGFKPVAVKFEVAGKIVNISFLESNILVRVTDSSLLNGQPKTLNTYSVTVANANVSLTERFSLGLAVVKPLIRDSMNSTAIDWAQLTAAFTLVQSDAHKLVVSAAPFVRTVLPYEGKGNNSEQLWLPVKITYNYKYKYLSFNASTQYIPIKNFTTGVLAHALVFGVGADVRVTKPDKKYDLRIFVDGQLWVQDNSDHFQISDQMDLSSVMAGLRANF